MSFLCVSAALRPTQRRGVYRGVYRGVHLLGCPLTGGHPALFRIGDPSLCSAGQDCSDVGPTPPDWEAVGWPKSSGVEQWLESSTDPCQSQGRLRPQALSFRYASRCAREARPPRHESRRAVTSFSVQPRRSRRPVTRRPRVGPGRRRGDAKSCSLSRSRRRLPGAMAIGQTPPLVGPSAPSHFGPWRTDVPQPVHPIRQRRWMSRRSRVGVDRP
jgi:hypothetical protein